MEQAVVDNILLSIDHLEQAVCNAHYNIANSKYSHPELLARLDCYRQVVIKQRELAQELERSRNSRDWIEANRLASLIRSSSQFIAGEMRAVIAMLRNRAAAARA